MHTRFHSSSILSGIALIGFFLSAPLAAQQPFPSKPVRLVVPYAPGGALDVSARIVASEMTKTLGQPVVVENRPGGAGTMGADFVSKSAPDGYVLCWCPTGPLTITPLSDPKIPYQPLRDLVPVSHVIDMENVLMARRDFPANDMKELVAAAKKSPSGFTFGTPGSGGTHHLGGEWLRQETGVQLVHVPYKGENPAVADLIGGQIDLVLGSASLAAPLLKEGKIKVIANLGTARSKLMPEVATVAEAGYSNYGWYNFIGINAPAGTSTAVINALSAAADKAVHEPSISEKFVGMGFAGIGGTPAEYGRFLDKETSMWGRLLKTTSITRE
jgi:tripartite-type tricarboxylate transporter receptor subunit TctC